MATLQTGKIKTCPKCAAQVKDLQFHLSDKHKINVEGRVLNFEDFDQFKIWKESMERETVSRYVKHSGGKKRKNGGVLTYYYCHRDGSYVPKGKNERSLKMIGSNKINGNCPSVIKVEQTNEGLKVLFISTHVGHTCDVGRMVLTGFDNKKVSGKSTFETPLQDLESRKNHIMKHISEIVSGIKTEAGMSALEKGFASLEAAVRNAENQNGAVEECVSCGRNSSEPPKKKNQPKKFGVLLHKKSNKAFKNHTENKLIVRFGCGLITGKFCRICVVSCQSRFHDGCLENVKKL